VLERIRFKAIECPFEVGRKQSQRIDAILTFSRLCGMECKTMKAGDLLQNFFCILCGDFSLQPKVMPSSTLAFYKW
jgi:hypothetical protein